MGSTTSQATQMKFLFNISSEPQELIVKVDQFLTQPYQPVAPEDIRRILLHEMFPLFVGHLIKNLDSSNPMILRNTLRLLTVVIPVIYESNQLTKTILFGPDPFVIVEEKKEVFIIKQDGDDHENLECQILQRNYVVLEKLCGLLFKKDFTIQGTDTFNIDNDPRLSLLLGDLLKKGVRVQLNHLWRGLATLTKYPNDQKQYYENRMLVLACLIACLGEQLFNERQRNNTLEYMVYNEHVEIFVSLWATILFYKRSYFWFQDNILFEQKVMRTLAVLSAQILLIVFSFESRQNKFRELVIQTNLLDYSFDLLIENLEQSLNYDQKLLAINPHNNKGVLEQLGLLYFLLTKNNHQKEFLTSMKVDQIQRLLNVLLYYINEFFIRRFPFQGYVICLEILAWVLNYENIGKFTQKKMNVSISTYGGTYQEFILQYFSNILIQNAHQRMLLFNQIKIILENYRADLICQIIELISLHCVNVNQTSNHMLQLAINLQLTYDFMLQQPQHANQANNLSAACLNMILNKNIYTLHELLKAAQLKKFRMTEKKIGFFFNKFETLKVSAEVIKTPDYEERRSKFLEIWKKVDFTLVLALQRLVVLLNNQIVAANLNPLEVPIEQFEKFVATTSLSFLNPIKIAHPASKFQLDSLAYSILLQQLEYMPVFDVKISRERK